MSRASNTFKVSDIITTALKVKYPVPTGSIRHTNTLGAGISVGINGPVSVTGSVPQSTVNYRSLRHLYYSNFLTGSFPVSASSADNYLQSTAAYGTSDADTRFFPTGSGEVVTAISIPRIAFGEAISKKSIYFDIVTGQDINFIVEDDGNGNLVATTYNYTAVATPIHVGNVIYSQGMLVFTDQYLVSYLNTADDLDIAFTAETTIYQNEVKCHIAENDFNYSQNPTVLYTPAQAFSSATLINNVTGSDFMPHATTVGLYNASNELLVVGKLGTPYPIPSNTDMTFIVRWDS